MPDRETNTEVASVSKRLRQIVSAHIAFILYPTNRLSIPENVSGVYGEISLHGPPRSTFSPALNPRQERAGRYRAAPGRIKVGTILPSRRLAVGPLRAFSASLSREPLS
jgi:hypothetical protein